MGVGGNLSSTSYTLTSLRPFETYGVLVRAHNAHGASEPSGVAEVPLGEEVWGAGGRQKLDVRVKLLSAELIGSSAVRVAWQVRLYGEGRVGKDAP